MFTVSFVNHFTAIIQGFWFTYSCAGIACVASDQAVREDRLKVDVNANGIPDLRNLCKSHATVRRNRTLTGLWDSGAWAAELKNIIEFRARPTDQERFDGLVRPHFEALYRSARRMTQSEQDAEDLLQEVFIKALSWLDELEKIEFPRAWLMKVMYNTFVDQARKEQRSPMSMAMMADEAGEPDRLPSEVDTPPRAADREIRIEQIIRAMRHMDSDHCALIAMRDVEGLSINELCRITGMPAGTVKAQLHRARKKLGRLLSNDAVTRPHLRVVGGQI